jgi:hypothetical protein
MPTRLGDVPVRLYDMVGEFQVLAGCYGAFGWTVRGRFSHAAGEECVQSDTDAGSWGSPFFTPLAVFKINCRAIIFVDPDGGDAATTG